MEASTNLGNLTDLEMVERHRASFNGKIAQMQDVASKKCGLLHCPPSTYSVREPVRKKIRDFLGVFPIRGGGFSSIPKLL